MRSIFQIFIWIFVCTQSMVGQSLDQVPLFDIKMLEYRGAFRLPTNTFGASSLSYCQGPIEYNPDNHSIFIVGHPHHQAIAEFAIPPLMVSDSIHLLNMAIDPIQEFVTVLDNTILSNPDGLNRIGGMCYLKNSSSAALVVNAYEYYDAPGDNITSTFVLGNANDLSSVNVGGMYALDNQAAHLAGWISPIPDSYSSLMGGTHIFGHSSGIPIISRTSVGPSAYVVDLSGAFIPSFSINLIDKLLGFSLANPLDIALSNENLTNNIWTHLSRAVYGFIIPGTRTYFTLGSSGGHNSGVCYKCTQNNGNLCGGYCAPDAQDYEEYYWLWDINDLLEVKEGLKNSYDVYPYDFGVFATNFGERSQEISGACFDPIEHKLYVTVANADTLQGIYSFPPVIEVFEIPKNLSTAIAAMDDAIEIFPNPSSNYFIIQGELDNFQLNLFDINGTVLLSQELAGSQKMVDISELSAGMIFIQLYNKMNQKLSLQKILKSN